MVAVVGAPVRVDGIAVIVGEPVGTGDGTVVGTRETEGLWVSCDDGLVVGGGLGGIGGSVGAPVGLAVGESVGVPVGVPVGAAVGPGD
jgi:hypothetical protein